MGVNTSADIIKDELQEDVMSIIFLSRQIRNSMEEMIDYETWGGGEWTDVFREEVESDIETLNKIINKLGKIKRHY